VLFLCCHNGCVHWNQKLWQRSIDEFPEFLEPLVAGLGRSERREGATLYVQGLLMPGERKSIEPMAERLGIDSQKLQQFVADSPWDEQEVWRAIRREVVPVMEPLAAWIIDETGWLKQGKSSVGVAHQYCGAVGKQANCQVSVEVVVSDGEIAAPVAGRLYLPEKWAADEARRQAAGVPPEVQFQAKPAIALELIKAVWADGVSPAPVLGDEVYGAASELRWELRQLGIEYFLNAGGDLLAWTKPVKTRLAKKYWGVAEGQPTPSSLATLSKAITQAQWHPVAWRAADGTKRKTRIAWLPVYVLSDLNRDNGEWAQTWLVVDWPEGDADPYHLYLAWLKTKPTAPRCLRLSRGRFPIEQFFQRDKTDLGLDHYEGRSWQGFHHHLVLAAVAYLFVTVIYLSSKKNFRCYVGKGFARDPAVVGAIDRMLSLLRNKISPKNQGLDLTE
jgi:SRSO17 transposase